MEARVPTPEEVFSGRALSPELPLEPTLVDWVGSPEQAEAQALAKERDFAAILTGISQGKEGAIAHAMFERVASRITRHLEVPVCLFSLIEGPCQMIVAASGIPAPMEVPSDTSLCVHVRDSGRDLVIDDLSRSLFAEVATNATAAGVGSYLGTPIFAPDGQPIGALCAIDMTDRCWEPSDLTVLKAMAEVLTDMIALLATKRT